jgi:hypothetical protein
MDHNSPPGGLFDADMRHNCYGKEAKWHSRPNGKPCSASAVPMCGHVPCGIARRAKLCHEHYLGLCPELAAAGPGAANEAVLPVILPQKLPSTDPNSDHKSSPRNRGTAHATSSGNASSKPTGSNGAGQSAGRSSSNTPAAAAAAKGKHQAQPLCMSGPGSCSSSSRPGHSGTAGTASGASPELDGGTKVTHFHLNELCRHNSSPGWKLSMDRMRYGRTVASDLSALR